MSIEVALSVETVEGSVKMMEGTLLGVYIVRPEGECTHTIDDAAWVLLT